MPFLQRLSAVCVAGALDPGELRLSQDTVFVGNAARVGVGVVPLPGDATR